MATIMNFGTSPGEEQREELRKHLERKSGAELCKIHESSVPLLSFFSRFLRSIFVYFSHLSLSGLASASINISLQSGESGRRGVRMLEATNMIRKRTMHMFEDTMLIIFVASLDYVSDAGTYSKQNKNKNKTEIKQK